MKYDVWFLIDSSTGAIELEYCPFSTFVLDVPLRQNSSKIGVSCFLFFGVLFQWCLLPSGGLIVVYMCSQNLAWLLFAITCARAQDMFYDAPEVGTELNNHDSSSLLLYMTAIIAFSRFFLANTVIETYYGGDVADPLAAWKASVTTNQVAGRQTLDTIYVTSSRRVHMTCSCDVLACSREAFTYMFMCLYP